MEMNDNENAIAQKGDLILMMNTKPMLVSEEGSLLACFWSLARVTGVTSDGEVSAYRTFGTHYVNRAIAGEYALLSGRKVDVCAIESDMSARVTKDADANEFALPDYAYEYVKTFMLEAANNPQECRI